MKFPNQTKNRGVIAILIIVFLTYNYFLYTQVARVNTPIMSELAIEGQTLFQENNCAACHQLYGLGGYLGPDLTNVISKEGKGPQYVKAFLNSGIKSMPKFHFSEEEMTAIVQFFKEVDQTGFYPNYNAEKKVSGWVEIKYKE